VVGLAIVLLAALSADQWLSRVVLLGLTALVASGAARWILGISSRLLDGPYYFLFGQVAVACGLAKGFLRTQSVLWEKADR
jgi:hypothetical protein